MVSPTAQTRVSPVPAGTQHSEVIQQTPCVPVWNLLTGSDAFNSWPSAPPERGVSDKSWSLLTCCYHPSDWVLFSSHCVFTVCVWHKALWVSPCQRCCCQYPCWSALHGQCRAWMVNTLSESVSSLCTEIHSQKHTKRDDEDIWTDSCCPLWRKNFFLSFSS